MLVVLGSWYWSPNLQDLLDVAMTKLSPIFHLTIVIRCKTSTIILNRVMRYRSFWVHCLYSYDEKQIQWQDSSVLKLMQLLLYVYFKSFCTGAMYFDVQLLKVLCSFVFQFSSDSLLIEYGEFFSQVMV